MNLETNSISKKQISTDLSLKEIIANFKETISSIKNNELSLLFESSVMPENGFKYFGIWIHADLKVNDSVIQIRLHLKYESTAPFFVLFNHFESSNQNEFWSEIEKTNVYNFINKENIKAIDTALFEIN